MYDVAIIGAGITGCAIAYELGKYNVKAVIVEKENDVSVGTTKANSAIIHGCLLYTSDILLIIYIGMSFNKNSDQDKKFLKFFI